MVSRQQRINLGLASPHEAISAAIAESYVGAESYATYDGATGVFKEQTREEFGASLRADLERAIRSSSPQPPHGRKHARDLRWCPLKEGDPRLDMLRRTQDDYTLEDSFHAHQDPLKLGIAERVGYDETQRRKAAGLPSLREELGAWLSAGMPVEEPPVEVPEEVYEDEMTLPDQMEDLDYKRQAALRRGDLAAVDAVERQTAALVRKHYPAQAATLPEKMDPAEVDVNMLSMMEESPLMMALYSVGWQPARAPFQEPPPSSPKPAAAAEPAAAPWAPKKEPPPRIVSYDFAPMPLKLIMEQEQRQRAVRPPTPPPRAALRAADRVARGPPASSRAAPAAAPLVPRSVLLAAGGGAARPPRVQTWSRGAAARAERGDQRRAAPRQEYAARPSAPKKPALNLADFL
jgi:hypothetical protein